MNIDPIIDSSGNKFWGFDAVLHREDGPALEVTNGTREWYRNGRLHRDDAPAVEYANGRKLWFKNGVEYKSVIDYCNALNMTEKETTLFLLKWS